MFKVSIDIYFVVYKLYYIDQNDDQGTRAGPIHRDGGSNYSCPYIGACKVKLERREEFLGVVNIFNANIFFRGYLMIICLENKGVLKLHNF
jgi:hypothetical protein